MAIILEVILLIVVNIVLVSMIERITIVGTKRKNERM